MGDPGGCDNDGTAISGGGGKVESEKLLMIPDKNPMGMESRRRNVTLTKNDVESVDDDSNLTLEMHHNPSH